MSVGPRDEKEDDKGGSQGDTSGGESGSTGGETGDQGEGSQGGKDTTGGGTEGAGGGDSTSEQSSLKPEPTSPIMPTDAASPSTIPTPPIAALGGLSSPTASSIAVDTVGSDKVERPILEEVQIAIEPKRKQLEALEATDLTLTNKPEKTPEDIKTIADNANEKVKILAEVSTILDNSIAKVETTSKSASQPITPAEATKNQEAINQLTTQKKENDAKVSTAKDEAQKKQQTLDTLLKTQAAMPEATPIIAPVPKAENVNLAPEKREVNVNEEAAQRAEQERKAQEEAKKQKEAEEKIRLEEEKKRKEEEEKKKAEATEDPKDKMIKDIKEEIEKLEQMQEALLQKMDALSKEIDNLNNNIQDLLKKSPRTPEEEEQLQKMLQKLEVLKAERQQLQDQYNNISQEITNKQSTLQDLLGNKNNEQNQSENRPRITEAQEIEKQKMADQSDKVYLVQRTPEDEEKMRKIAEDPSLKDQQLRIYTEGGVRGVIHAKGSLVPHEQGAQFPGTNLDEAVSNAAGWRKDMAASNKQVSNEFQVEAKNKQEADNMLNKILQQKVDPKDMTITGVYYRDENNKRQQFSPEQLHDFKERQAHAVNPQAAPAKNLQTPRPIVVPQTPRPIVAPEPAFSAERIEHGRTEGMKCRGTFNSTQRFDIQIGYERLVRSEDKLREIQAKERAISAQPEDQPQYQKLGH